MPSTLIKTSEKEPWCRNLRHSFDELLEHLEEIDEQIQDNTESSGQSLLDCVFTVCALSQVLDDFLHRGFLGFDTKMEIAATRPQKFENYLDFLPPKVVKIANSLVRMGPMRLVARSIDAMASWHVRIRSLVMERRLLGYSVILRRIASDLAHLYACGEDDAPIHLARIIRGVTGWHSPPHLRRRVLKIPSCFKDFDCHPDDCRELVRLFTERFEDRNRSLTVLGIRTSGSYLAPFYTAYLRLAGFVDVETASIRPKVPLFGFEQRLLKRRSHTGLVILVDDPPVTGNAQVQVIRALEALGIGRKKIIPLILKDPDAPLFRDRQKTKVKNSLTKMNAIILSMKDWRIQKVLDNPNESMEVLPFSTARTGKCRMSRCHLKVRQAEPDNAGQVIKGTGIGWFEDHVHETVEVLKAFVPRSTTKEGYLVMEWVDGPTLEDRPKAQNESLTLHVAKYVTARLQGLAVESGEPGTIDDNEGGWHVLAQSFSQSYSFLAPFALYKLQKRLVQITQGAPRMIVDGKMGPAEWIFPGNGHTPVKVDFEEHDFDRMDMCIFDPTFDLAGFIIENRLPESLEMELLSEYIRLSNDWNALDRIVYFKLMVGVCKQMELRLLLVNGGGISFGFDGNFDRKTVAMEITEVNRTLTRTANSFLAKSLEAEQPVGSSDKIFAVDLDGVLEDSTLGFNTTTPAGALAIRTMKAHNFLPVVVTGRSLMEVLDRSRTFGLTAGAAEYGSVIWIDSEPAPISLTPENQMEQLRRLKSILLDTDDVIVDLAYEHSVRAFLYKGGSRWAVPLDRMKKILKRAGLNHLRIVPGEAQLDVVGIDCNKGKALMRLREMLGAREVHAVGDTIEDVAMFEVSDHAYAPSNVQTAAVKKFGDPSLYIAKRKRECGLLEVARVAAHGNNRTCKLCERPSIRAQDLELVRAFGIRDRSHLKKIFDLIRPGALHHFIVSQ